MAQKLPRATYNDDVISNTSSLDQDRLEDVSAPLASHTPDEYSIEEPISPTIEIQVQLPQQPKHGEPRRQSTIQIHQDVELRNNTALDTRDPPLDLFDPPDDNEAFYVYDSDENEGMPTERDKVENVQTELPSDRGMPFDAAA